jgi:hypothetical protein
MGKTGWDEISDLVFKFFWYFLNLALIGIPWFFYRIRRKAYADAMNLDVERRK